MGSGGLLTRACGCARRPTFVGGPANARGRLCQQVFTSALQPSLPQPAAHRAYCTIPGTLYPYTVHRPFSLPTTTGRTLWCGRRVAQALTLAGCTGRKFMSSTKALDAKWRDSKVEQGDIGECARARVSCPTCECVTLKPWSGRWLLHGRRRIQRCRRGR